MVLARWLNWLERHPMHQKVVGSIPSQGTYPRLQVQSLVRVCTEGKQMLFFSHVMSPSLLPFPLTLKSVSKSSGEYKINNFF